MRPDSPRDGDTVGWDPAGGWIDHQGLEGTDAVVHLAGENLFGRWTAAKKRRIRDSRVAGTRLLAEALAELDDPPSVLLSGSAVGVYGSRDDEVLTEESRPGAGFLAGVCRQWETATRPAEDAGIRVVHLRTAPVHSPDALLLKLQLPAFRVGLGARLGSGQQWMAWIHLTDHVRATLHLLDHTDATGPVNLTAPAPIRNADYAATLGRVLGRPVFLSVPTVAVAAVFGADAAREFATASQRTLPARLIDDLGFTFDHPDLEQALRDILDRPG